MRRWLLIPALFLLLAACREKEPAGQPGQPAIRLELQQAGAFQATVSVSSLHATAIAYGVAMANGETPPMEQRVETGSDAVTETLLVLKDLEPLTDYILSARGIGPGEEEGPVQTLSFQTEKGPDSLYPWEKARSGVPTFADLSLITQGWHNASPPVWTAERFASHVVFDGKWLFDAFLCIDGFEKERGLSYSITNTHPSADKAAWETLLDAWLGPEGSLLALDEAIAQAARSLGAPPRKRLIVMEVPDPIRFRYFADKNSVTTYWGDGRDFARVEDQQAACRWYMDQCRARFNSLGFKHLELAGFYILSEELHLAPDFYRNAGKTFDAADTWNWEYKQWEEIIPYLAAYAHACNEGLWWIPYHLAPGYRVWKELGIDQAFMQPNYYWDHDGVSHPLGTTIKALQGYRMGLELEFEYSLVASVMADGRSAPDGNGSPAFYAKDVPLLRTRVREYMAAYRESGLYGALPVAVYSGTDAWHQLAGSPDPGDKEMFREICTFIQESPLKP